MQLRSGCVILTASYLTDRRFNLVTYWAYVLYSPNVLNPKSMSRMILQEVLQNQRRGRDSNPGDPFGAYALSRRAPSANSDTSPDMQSRRDEKDYANIYIDGSISTRNCACAYATTRIRLWRLHHENVPTQKKLDITITRGKLSACECAHSSIG
jgi:hypothetical protein